MVTPNPADAAPVGGAPVATNCDFVTSTDGSIVMPERSWRAIETWYVVADCATNCAALTCWLSRARWTTLRSCMSNGADRPMTMAR